MRWFPSKISFPSAYAVLMLVIVLGAVLTWMLPAGRYDLLRYDQAHGTFVAERLIGEETLPGEQATLDRLGIRIQLEHFKKGNIRKAVSIPGTYHQVTANPQGLIAILKAPVLGTYEAIDVILFVLVIGGFIGVFQKTGAFDAGLNALVLRLHGREAWLIIIVTALISLGGTNLRHGGGNLGVLSIARAGFSRGRIRRDGPGRGYFHRDLRWNDGFDH